MGSGEKRGFNTYMLPFDEHLKDLAERLRGRDPRRGVGPVEGVISLLLRDEEGVLRRASIEIDRESARVHFATLHDPSRPKAIVRGPLSDWIAFLSERADPSMGTLELYGEPTLVAGLHELLGLRQSPVALRARVASGRDF